MSVTQTSRKRLTDCIRLAYQAATHRGEGVRVRPLLVGLLVSGGLLPASAAAAGATKPRASVSYDHRGAQRTAIYRLSLKDGQGFDVVINNTAESCFDYSVEQVAARDTGLEATGGIALATKVIPLVHSKEFGGYIVSIQRSSDTGACAQGDAKPLKDSSIIVSVETPGWEVEVSGGFTASGLTNPVYGTVRNEQGNDVVVEDVGARDDASLGVASFLHVFHSGQPGWMPAIGFGLGINETSKPTYHLGAFWRLGRAALVGGGVVLGSVDRLPVGVEVGGTLSDPNLLAQLPTRIDTQWFVGISFSFLGGKEPFEKPFGPPQKADVAASPSAGARRTARLQSVER
jgi:hypothetical protein